MGCGYGEPTTGREGDVMSEAFGSADAAEHWSLNSVVLRVKPEDMMRTAADLDAMADKIDTWVQTKSDGLTFPPMGDDEVSHVVADTVHASAHDEQFGLVPNLKIMRSNFRQAADHYRAKARDYYRTEESNAQGFGSRG